MRTQLRTGVQVTSAVVFALCLGLGPSWAEDYTCITNNGTITITGYIGSGGDVAIPGEISGLPVTTIGESAFRRCTSLTSITIPDSVSSIGFWAFNGCSGLTSVRIGNSVTSINTAFVYACSSLTAITVGAFNPNYSSVDGVLFNKGQTTLILCPQGKTSNYTIPDSVTSIGDSAFYGCSRLTSVTIPDSVTNIGERSFANCTSLTDVTIPTRVISIGSSTFANCTDLTSVTIPDSVTTIGTYAFADCTSLTCIPIPNSVTNIGYGTFASCKSLSNITVAPANPAYRSVEGVLFDRSLTVIIQYPQGRGSSYIIPEGVTTIGYSAFGGTFTAPQANLTSVTIPNSVQIIDALAFLNCVALTHVVLPEGVYLSSGAFAYCTNLTSVVVPAGAHMGCLEPHMMLCYGVFMGCTSLTNATISDGVPYIGFGAFAGCTSLSEVNLPNSVTSIDGSAFWGCTSLTTVTLPETVGNVGKEAFAWCTSLEEIKVDPANLAYSCLEGVLFDKTVTKLIQCPGGKMGVYLIPDSVTSIGGSGFGGCKNLTSVIVSHSVTNIGFLAFAECDRLVALYFQVGELTFDGELLQGTDRVTLYYPPGADWFDFIEGNPTALWTNPLLYVDNVRANANEFALTTVWIPNRTLVIETCPDLANPTWSGIATNTPASGTWHFSDSDSVDHLRRFYRVRAQ